MARRSRNNRAPRETDVSRYQKMMRELAAPPTYNVFADHKAAQRYGWKSPTLNTTLQQLDDRRTWHPERWGRPVVGTRRASTRIVIGTPSSMLKRSVPASLAFADPRRVVVCLRRKARKEVLLALGMGGGGNKSPKRKPTSGVQC